MCQKSCRLNKLYFYDVAVSVREAAKKFVLQSTKAYIPPPSAKKITIFAASLREAVRNLKLGWGEGGLKPPPLRYF